MSGGGYRFLCDENVNRKAVEAMRRRDIDAVHVIDLDMMSASDSEVMAVAVEQGRILITRDYSDFGIQIVHQVMQEKEFPGILFISPSIPEGDAGALLRAVEAWSQRSEASYHSIRNTAEWLTLPDDDVDFGLRVREATVPYLSALARISQVSDHQSVLATCSRSLVRRGRAGAYA